MTAPKNHKKRENAGDGKSRRSGRKILLRRIRRVALGLLFTASVAYTGLLASYSGTGEKLTKGETELVQGVFGDEINTSKIRKHFKNENHITHVLPSKRGTVLPPHSHIDFFGPTVTSADFSKDAKEKTGLFIHEATHVWQNQNAAWQLNKLHICRKYDYTLKPTSQFRDFGVEQQASIIEDYVECWWHKDGPAQQGTDMNAQDSLLLKVVETRFPRAKQTRAAQQPSV